jgi:predicted metal-binding membrane protein
MARTQADQLLGQRNLLLGLLAGAAAAAWALLAWQAAGETHMAVASPTMGMRAPVFLAVWVLMMVAMMFPTAAPMIVTAATRPLRFRLDSAPRRRAAASRSRESPG